jgi:hypothetical protein
VAYKINIFFIVPSILRPGGSFLGSQQPSLPMVWPNPKPHRTGKDLYASSMLTNGCYLLFFV